LYQNKGVIRPVYLILNGTAVIVYAILEAAIVRLESGYATLVTVFTIPPIAGILQQNYSDVTPIID